MVKHIIIWKLDESLSAEEKQKVKKEAKAALEALCGKVPGLVSLTLHTEILPSSTGDIPHTWRLRIHMCARLPPSVFAAIRSRTADEAPRDIVPRGQF